MRSKWYFVFSALVLVSMILAACAPAATTVAPVPTTAPAATIAPKATDAAPKATDAAPKATEATKATAAPTKSAAPAAPVAAKDSVRINIITFPDNLDPQQASFVAELAHLKLVYEGLTRLDKDLKTVPAAAEKWTYNADATEITFAIRKGLMYSDGSLLNAKRFEYSILRNIDPTTAGEYARITDDIAGAADWGTADLKKATPEELTKLKAAIKIQALDAAGAPCKDYTQADCLTLKIGFGQSAPYFHTVASLWVTYPVKEEIIKTGTDTAKWWLSPKNHIGNGPMVWQTLEEKQKSVFIPSTTYWRGTAKVNIEYRYIVDGAVAYAAYKNNEFDVITLGAEDLKVTKVDPTLSKEIQNYPGSCTFAVMFHQQKEPFTDPKVRAAFAYALDRDGWVKDVLHGLGSATLTWIPKGFPGYDATEARWGFDAAKAKQALADSTYKTADKLPPIKLTFSDSPRNRTRYEWLAAKWKEVLGVSVQLNPVESTAYTALTKNVATAPQVFILGWCADYPDPQNWLSVYWKTGGFGQRIAYANPALDKVIVQGDTATDATKRMDYYAQAQKLLTDGVPVAFMWNSVNVYLVKPAVKGLVLTPQDADFPGSSDPLTISIQK